MITFIFSYIEGGYVWWEAGEIKLADFYREFGATFLQTSLVRDKTCLLVVIYKNNINHEMYLMLSGRLLNGVLNDILTDNCLFNN